MRAYSEIKRGGGGEVLSSSLLKFGPSLTKLRGIWKAFAARSENLLDSRPFPKLGADAGSAQEVLRRRLYGGQAPFCGLSRELRVPQPYCGHNENVIDFAEVRLAFDGSLHVPKSCCGAAEPYFRNPEFALDDSGCPTELLGPPITPAGSVEVARVVVGISLSLKH
jgi:hypothetical protein